MTYAEMKAEVRRQLAAHSGATFWSDVEIGEALNAGLMEISDATEWNEAVVTVALTGGCRYYDLRCVVGETFLGLRPSFDVQTNQWLIPSTVAELDARDRRWEMTTGEPQRMFTRGPFFLGLWPVQQSDLGTIKLYHTALPPALEDDDDEPGLPETWQMACVDFAMTELWAMDGETALALQAWTRYLEAETALGAWVNHRASEAARTGFGGDIGSYGSGRT